MIQEQLDVQIKTILKSYLTHNNSVSGNNFIRLIAELNEIENQWIEHCKEYEKLLTPSGIIK
jgi:hypothetical protein